MSLLRSTDGTLPGPSVAPLFTSRARKGNWKDSCTQEGKWKVAGRGLAARDHAESARRFMSRVQYLLLRIHTWGGIQFLDPERPPCRFLPFRKARIRDTIPYQITTRYIVGCPGKEKRRLLKLWIGLWFTTTIKRTRVGHE
jgi:hypothetical protein